METYLPEHHCDHLLSILEEGIIYSSNITCHVPKHVLQCLCILALKKHSMSAIFQCQEKGPVAKAHSKLQAKPEHVHLVKGVLNHPWLFPQCAAVLHHGGSGTVATALLSGRPQIICPVMFDQNMWAEHLSWMGVAYQCPSPEKLSVTELSHALEFIAGESVCVKIKDLCKALMSENGIKLAVDKIEKTLNGRT